MKYLKLWSPPIISALIWVAIVSYFKINDELNIAGSVIIGMISMQIGIA